MLYLSFVPLVLALESNILVSGRGIIQTADIFMMVAVSTERYKAICQPLVPRQPYYMYLIFVAATSIGLEFPRFFEFKLNDNHTDYDTTNLVRFHSVLGRPGSSLFYQTLITISTQFKLKVCSEQCHGEL